MLAKTPIPLMQFNGIETVTVLFLLQYPVDPIHHKNLIPKGSGFPCPDQ
jgi:hypothetical protein